MSGLRERLLSKRSEIAVEAVHIDGDDSPYYVRRMRTRDRAAFDKAVSVKSGKKTEFTNADFRAKLLSFTVCDEKGERLFDASDVGLIADLPAVVVEPLVAAAAKLNGLTDDSVEEAAKNSEAAPSASS